MSNGSNSEKVFEGSGFGALERSADERSESGRSGGVPKPAARPERAVPEPEVSARPKRRRFTGEYKARIVEEAETCLDVGALLRREGLYSSHLTNWRREYRSGALMALKDDKRGRKKTKNPLEDEVARLQRENARLAHRLEQAETVIEIQKKVSTMLGIPLKDEPSEGND
jgi:transposase-like protein